MAITLERGSYIKKMVITLERGSQIRFINCLK